MANFNKVMLSLMVLAIAMLAAEGFADELKGGLKFKERPVVVCKGDELKNCAERSQKRGGCKNKHTKRKCCATCMGSK